MSELAEREGFSLTENLGMRLVEACLEERSASEIEALSKNAQSFAVYDPELRMYFRHNPISKTSPVRAVP